MIVEPVGLDVDALPKPLDFAAVFGNDRPVEMEIGMGKGTFITESARAHPKVNFFGIEWARWFWRYASDRLRRNGCLNARTVRADAAFFVREFVKDDALAVLHIYFPDPWPKKRHHKRRLVQPAFAELLARKLREGGILHLATDWQDYAEHMRAVLAESDRFRPLHTEALVPRPESRAETHFERRGLKLGHAVSDLLYQRC